MKKCNTDVKKAAETNERIEKRIFHMEEIMYRILKKVENMEER